MSAINSHDGQTLTGHTGEGLANGGFNIPYYPSWNQLGFSDWQPFPDTLKNGYEGLGLWQQPGLVPEYSNINWSSEPVEFRNCQVDQISPSGSRCSPSEAHFQSSTLQFQPLEPVPQPPKEPSPTSYEQAEPEREPSPKKSRRKGKQVASGHPPSKPTRRKRKLDDEAREQPEKSQRKTIEIQTPESDNGSNSLPTESHKKLQERNRLAANRFRVRKRKDTVKLKNVEHEMQQQHRQLSASAEKLTQEVYELKLQLLRHSDCNCILIQNYIKTEAHRYIHGMDREPRDRSLDLSFSTESRSYGAVESRESLT